VEILKRAKHKTECTSSCKTEVGTEVGSQAEPFEEKETGIQGNRQ
jgi:hypothetical protein